MRDDRIVILGGHGKVALLAAPRLVAAGRSVDAVIRNPKHADDVRAAGANPVVLDIERATTVELAELFTGAEAVVFSAGAGGGNPARTHAVDFEAAVRSMDAAARAGVPRFVTVSYATADTDVDTLDPADSFFPYARAKHDADAYLRGTDLDWTILGPGRLTLDEATGLIDRDLAHPTGATSRDNVAAVITHVVTTGAGSRETINFYDGEVPIAEAIPLRPGSGSAATPR
ncbi:SDR family oxidoreductase [Aestuariimicrobium soli]|uniref:SDR family oxidoreductase n=1 Tax=Aestuariimicrobium soli TaxID=2035834 RepID=UPI003EBC44B3